MSSTSAPPSQSLISKLPPELFSLIVDAVAQCERPRPPASEENDIDDMDSRLLSLPWNQISQGGFLGWIRLTHVCSIWRRKICEEMPLLWARHIGCLPTACEEMLRRAGETAPLDVQLGYNQIHSNIPLDDSFFRRCLGRIRSLFVINVGTSELHDPIPSALCQSSVLQHIEVHYLELNYDYLEDDSFEGDEVTVLVTPLLRTARFTNYFIPCTSRSLTHLYLAFDDVGLPYKVLQDTLGQISETIEELELDMCIPKSFREYPPDPHTFPRLKYLSVREVNELLGIFVAQISAPSSPQLNLTVTPYDMDWAVYLRPLVVDVFRRLTLDFAFDVLEVSAVVREKRPCREWAQLVLSESETHQRTFPPRRNCPAVVLSHEHHAKVDEEDALSTMFDELVKLDNNPLNSITYLDFDAPLWQFEQQAIKALNCLPHVRHIRLVDPLDCVSREESPTLPTEELTFRIPHRLEHLHLVQHNDSHALPVIAMCELLQSRLGLTMCAESEPLPAVAHLHLQIVESGPISSDAGARITAMFTKFAGNLELDIEQAPAQRTSHTYTRLDKATVSSTSSGLE